MNAFAKQLPQIKKQLDSWFLQDLVRGTTVDKKTLVVETNAAILAAQLYKRNGIYIDGINETQCPNFTFEPVQIKEYQTWDSLKDVFSHKHFFVIDKNTSKFLPKSFTQLPHFFIDADEKIKNIDTLFSVVCAIPDLCTEVIGLGGGLTCDIAGCASAIIKKRFSVVPTTLLAGIDASVGGKTGVNHPQYGKNQIGLFNHIQDFYIISEAFETLKPWHLTDGYAEALKHYWLTGREDLAPPTDLKLPKNLNAFIKKHIQFKQSIVTLDLFEIGLRKILNLGHTYGHVIETLGELGYIENMSHGRAVTLGLTAEINCLPPDSDNFWLLNKKLLSEVLNQILLRKPVPSALIESLIKSDKKRNDENIFLLNIEFGTYGRPTLQNDVSYKKIEIKNAVSEIFEILNLIKAK